MDSVVPREFEGMSAADGCARSLGGMKALGVFVVARVPVVIVPSMSVPVCVVTSVVPVCVVLTCVCTSVAKCVLQRTHSVGARACEWATACVTEAPRVDETPVCGSDPVCEWCGGECARMRASQHAVCERGTTSGRGRVCEGNGTRVRTAVCE